MPVRVLPNPARGSTFKCVLNCTARTFSYSVDGGAPVTAFEGLPVGRALYPAVLVYSGARVVYVSNYRVPHVHCIIRTREMYLRGCLSVVASDKPVFAWLSEAAPMWVVMRVCALLMT